MSQQLISYFIAQFKTLQTGYSWLDETFHEKMEAVSDGDAFRRPIPEIHSAAELISHVLEWRKECLRRLNQQEKVLSVQSADNWKSNAVLEPLGWTALKTAFYSSTDTIIDFLITKQDAYLQEVYSDGDTLEQILTGLLHHDVYHLGQLGITVKLLNHP